MTKSTPSLSFPDVNVWLALTLEHHVHRPRALKWWKEAQGTIAFTRVTQLSLLRLLTTAAAMDSRPLTMTGAWRVHDRLFDDDRVVLMPEPASVEAGFRKRTAHALPSPKLWADAWLLSVANASQGVVLTFDQVLVSQGARCLL